MLEKVQSVIKIDETVAKSLTITPYWEFRNCDPDIVMLFEATWVCTPDKGVLKVQSCTVSFPVFVRSNTP